MARKTDPLRMAIIDALAQSAMTRRQLREIVIHQIPPGDAFRVGQYNLERKRLRTAPARPRDLAREQIMMAGRNHLFAHMVNDLRRRGYVGVNRRSPRADDVITLIRVPPAIAFERRTKAAA